MVLKGSTNGKKKKSKKKCSISLAIREMQTNINCEIPCHPSQNGYQENNKCW
jgi:hypothetical protein